MIRNNDQPFALGNKEKNDIVNVDQPVNSYYVFLFHNLYFERIIAKFTQPPTPLCCESVYFPLWLI